MKTQFQDTSIEAERVLIDLIRGAPAHKRFQLVQLMTRGSFLANIQAQKNKLNGDERETAIRLVSTIYDPQLAQQLQSVLVTDTSWHVHPVDLAVLIFEVSQILEEIHAEWYPGSSVNMSDMHRG